MGRGWGRPLWVLVLVGNVCAEPVVLTAAPQESLGLWASVLVEEGAPLSLEQVRSPPLSGTFRPGARPVLTFGIGARPVWARLELNNPTGQPLPVRLVLGTTWIDHLDVYVVQDGQVSARWQTGDSYPRAPGLVPATGFVFRPTLAPGISELYLRLQTEDPLVLPIKLEVGDREIGGDLLLRYGYGFLYGFLIALVIYNGVLYRGLRERSYLYYALLLVSFILCNLAYTGHGAAWLWPDWPGFQRYVILVMMVLYASCGLLFASRFLALAEHAPRVLRGVQVFAAAGLGLLGLSLAMGSQRGTALLAFNFVTLFTLLMVALGVMTVRHGRSAGGYFLAASCGAMLGAVTTALTVWGWVPFHPLGFHGAEIGVLAEATLLALALATQVRQHETARQSAEQLARRDSLTGVHNRRSFWELAEPIWRTAEREGQSLSLVMLDIDFFKQINDRHGHEVGDRVLVDIAQLLSQSCRAGDILARWGGEEFLLLLPETTLEQACVLVERMRQLIAARRLAVKHELIAFTASFGVAARGGHATLGDLIGEADDRLYAAKSNGRNQVVGASASPVPA